MRVLAAVVLIALAQPPAQEQSQQQKPTFKSGVELVMVDVQVVDKKGNPVENLGMGQFEVSIDGKRRRVVSSQMVDSATGLPRGADNGTAASGGGTRPGNLYVLAVDQGSFRASNAPSVIYAVSDFLKRVQPNDYVGIISFPTPGVWIDPTRDRAALAASLNKIVGFSALKQTRRADFSLAETIDISAGDKNTLATVVARNCRDPLDRGCSQSVEMEMQEVISVLEMQASRSLYGLRDVVKTLTGMEGRKTVIVISAGIPSGDRTGGRLYMKNEGLQVGRDAVTAGIVLYTLHLNTAFLDQHSPDAPSTRQSPMREANVYARGLDLFNGHGGGTFFEVNTGADSAISRVIREMSMYYLLGVEVDNGDHDGKTHLIQVKVNQKDTAVRSRGSVVIPKKAASSNQ